MLSAMGATLRRVLHTQLIDDMARMFPPIDGLTIDFSGAHPVPGGLRTRVHDGLLVALAGVRVLGPEDALVFSGELTFIHDELADFLVCWWVRGPGIPPEIWAMCDLGVRRRLAHHPRWSTAAVVRAFAAARHERV